MKPFRAIHIKQTFVEESTSIGSWSEEEEDVLIIKIIAMDASSFAVFVRTDGTMELDSLQHFKNCEPDWRGN